MRNRRFVKMTSSLLSLIVLCSFIGIFSPAVFAEDSVVNAVGRVFTFDEKSHYEYSSADSSEAVVPGTNTYGCFSIDGTLTSDGVQSGVPSYLVSGEAPKLIYTYTDALLIAEKDSWHLVEDKTKKVDDISLPSNIRYGALILQTSKDGINWYNDITLTNLFKDTPSQTDAFYVPNSIQLANGCYFRVIVVYKTAIKVDQNQILFIKSDEFDYRKTAEVYEFYLHDNSADAQDSTIMSRSLGSLTNTGKDNGYFGNNDIGINDPHYRWNIGRFFVSGYTRETKDDDGTPVFLKNVGDQITLWFNLEQNIDQLNGDSQKSIADDTNGYDQHFQTDKTNMGRGTLIIQYTDEKGIKHEPEIYTNYLLANATTSADTIVRLFEEGDYEVALDYEIKYTPREVSGVEIIPEYSDYRISFKFSVRNGNCMVYPFDVLTGDELSNEAITPNGFKLDMARSRYLTIDVKRSIVTEGTNGYTEDVRFNRPAKDGDSYTEPGIYVFSVKNLYTGESTTKTIYVGTADYMNALSINRISVAQLNAYIDQGATIEDDGTITMPTSSEKPEAPIVSSESEVEVGSTEEPAIDEGASPIETTEQPDPAPISEASTSQTDETDHNESKSGIIIPLVIGSLFVVAIVWFLVRKKKTAKEVTKK